MLNCSKNRDYSLEPYGGAKVYLILFYYTLDDHRILIINVEYCTHTV